VCVRWVVLVCGRWVGGSVRSGRVLSPCLCILGALSEARLLPESLFLADLKWHLPTA